MSRVRQGALLGALALACTPRCAACNGATTPESPPPPPDVREYGDTIISDGQWTVVVDEGGALRVRFNNTDVITSAFKLGGTAGASFDPEPGNTTRVGEGVRFEIAAPGLGVRVGGEAQPSAHGARIAYTLHAERDVADVSGGGIELTIRNDARIFGKRAGEPVALPGGNGFTWDSGRGVVRFEFEQKLPLVQATPSGGMQCALYYQQLGKGEHPFTLNVTLPDGGAWALAPFTRYPMPDASWHASTLPWNDTPVDLSFLNDGDEPAGVHGPVRIEGERFVRGDGEPLKLWGTNVVSYALFNAGDDEIVRQAKRIAAFGFNLVRLHHHDSAWVEPNVFGRRAPSTLHLDPASLDRIDRWVAALQAEGIYVWIDLHVGRELTAKDGITAHGELQRNDPHGFNYVNPSIAAAMQAFARAYLDRENPHTGRRYTDDPGVVGVLVTNENDLTMHYGNLMLDRSGRPVHHGWLEARTREFAERTGLEVASPVEPWRLGNTKLAMGDIEAAFYRDAIADLRALGYRGGVATSSLWGDESMFSLPSLTVGDIVDTHSYGGPETLSSNAHVDPHFVHLVATAAVPGLPLSITEWNIPAPIRDRFVGPTLVAGIAALQGWAAPMLFAYTSNPLEEPLRPEIWSSWDDPAVMAMMPAAALMFRRDVSPAREHFAVQIDRDTLIGREANAFTLATVRTLTERSRVRVVLPTLPEVPWMRGTEVPEGAQVLTEPDEDRLERSAHVVESDTGELRRDWLLGVHTVDTSRNVSASGWIGGQSLELGDVRIDVVTPKAAVAVSSLDGLPLGTSKRILISAVAQVAATGGNARPYLSEPVVGTLSLRSEHAHLHVQRLGAKAGKAAPIDSRAEAGVHRIALDGAPVHFWLVTEATD